ncbi:MAG: hypothetical protein ACJAR3_000786 [Roseivirga sp.]
MQTIDLKKSHKEMNTRTLFVIIALAFFSCNPDKNTQIDQSTVTFKTSSSSKLYFKNIRQSYYDFEEMEVAKLEIFRLKKREQTEERPVINISIVNNWRYDEAYILLEPNALIQQNSLKLRWTNNESMESDTISFAQGNKSEILKFADLVYQQIQNKSSFEIESNSIWLPFMDETPEREAFRITMFDYYKLVQRL